VKGKTAVRGFEHERIREGGRSYIYENGSRLHVFSLGPKYDFKKNIIYFYAHFC
jgi:hypothetical protein